jgi:DnaK suppressor protein
MTEQKSAEQPGGVPQQDHAAQRAVLGLAVRDDESPWSAQEIAELETELRAELLRLGGEVDRLRAAIVDVMRDGGDGAGDDQADTGSKAFEREQEMILIANTRQTLFQTERALRRITDGSYGACESCGNAIGKLRLQAFPRATQCVSCKQKQERR